MTESGANRLADLLAQLDEVAAALLAFYDNLESDAAALPVLDEWSAQDVLAHLTFWHESFARNVRDLATETPPTPLRGRLGDLNEQGVADMRGQTLPEIRARFEAAQALIRAHILHPAVTMIPYRKGSRDYAPDEHLEIVRDHIRGHLRDLEKAARRHAQS